MNIKQAGKIKLSRLILHRKATRGKTMTDKRGVGVPRGKETLLKRSSMTEGKKNSVSLGGAGSAKQI